MGDLWRRRRDTGLWSSAAKHLRYRFCVSASQLSGKEAIKGRAVPSRSEPRHVEATLGSREWDGQTALALKTTLWKRKWQPQINSTFQWTISSFGRRNSARCSLFPSPPTHFSTPPTPAFFTSPPNYPILWAAVGRHCTRKVILQVL